MDKIMKNVPQKVEYLTDKEIVTLWKLGGIALILTVSEVQNMSIIHMTKYLSADTEGLTQPFLISMMRLVVLEHEDPHMPTRLRELCDLHLNAALSLEDVEDVVSDNNPIIPKEPITDWNELDS